ncbi:M56 family metallopeptidase [Clostridium butyricum]|uniref:M56 family metallopeptidase n=1 Tax=Clostridium butyricum TaxID=1492 RepID=UPI0009038799|nr:M56 family metallopeptidase [Clostridium butyricum]APF22464.1 blaR1 peptidase M56 family protein [Clostridium butyricum]
MKILEQLFLNFLETSLTGTIFILIVLCIFKIFNKQINARIKHILCFWVLLRILVPINPYIDISFAHILRSYDNVKETQEYNDREFKGMPYDNALKSNDILKSDEIEKNNNIYLENNLTNSDGVKEYNNSVNILYISTLIWSLGVVIVALVFNMSVIKFKIFSKSAEKINNNEIEQYMYSLIKNKNLKRNIPIYICNGMNSPCIIGIIKPKIYLPQYILKLDKETIRHVLLHEFMHYKRRDLYINFLSGILLAFHWFNPLVWIFIGKMKIYRECACDLSVLEILGEDSSIDYGMTIINLSKIFFDKNNLNVGLEFKGNNKMRERIDMIKRFKGGSYKITLAAALGCMLVTTVLFTTGIKVNALNLDNEGKGNNQIDTKKVTQTNIDDKHEFLIDSDIKNYRDINKTQNLSRFKFKVPDFTMSKISYNSQLVRLENNEELVNIYFKDKDGISDNKNSFILQIFDGDPREVLQKNSQIQFESSLRRYGVKTDYSLPVEIKDDLQQYDDLNGKCLTISTKYSDTNLIKNKYYLWQNDGLWYSIRYYKSLINGVNEEVSNDISLDNVYKIANSLVELNKVTNSLYESKFGENDISGVLSNIYDKEDLKSAEKLLGFNLKIPIKFNENIQINNCDIEYIESSEGRNYNLCSQYNYGEKGSVILSQSDKNIYNNWYDMDKIEKIKLSDIDVLKYADNYYDNQLEKEETHSLYFWNKEGIYYALEIYNSVDDENEIVKEFIDSNPIE